MKISARSLTVEYRSRNGITRALGSINFDVEDEFVVLLGLSGTGKSTLLRVLAGLIEPTSGKVRFSLDREMRIGMVFQDYSLLPWRTALDNVRLSMRLRNIEDGHNRAVELLEQVGLGDSLDKFPYQLSGGMKQRVAVASALAGRPDLLLLDEPFGALDAVTREDLQELLDDLYDGESTPTFFVTHDVEEAVYLADRIFVFAPEGGSIVGEIEVPFPRPRDTAIKETPVFQRHRHRAFGFLRGESSEAKRGSGPDAGR